MRRVIRGLLLRMYVIYVRRNNTAESSILPICAREITLNTSRREIAVCNLGSVNLPRHYKNGKLDLDKLRKTVRTAVRMLDNVIDINYYPVPEARYANMKHRPIGLGLMGSQDVLQMLRIPYASPDAVELADRTMEHISYYALEASSGSGRRKRRIRQL